MAGGRRAGSQTNRGTGTVEFDSVETAQSIVQEGAAGRVYSLGGRSLHFVYDRNASSRQASARSGPVPGRLIGTVQVDPSMPPAGRLRAWRRLESGPYKSTDTALIVEFGNGHEEDVQVPSTEVILRAAQKCGPVTSVGLPIGSRVVINFVRASGVRRALDTSLARGRPPTIVADLPGARAAFPMALRGDPISGRQVPVQREWTQASHIKATVYCPRLSPKILDGRDVRSTVSAIGHAFSRYGTVKIVSLSRDDRQLLLGSAFVTFSEPREAEAALAASGQAHLMGIAVRTDDSTPGVFSEDGRRICVERLLDAHALAAEPSALKSAVTSSVARDILPIPSSTYWPQLVRRGCEIYEIPEPISASQAPK